MKKDRTLLIASSLLCIASLGCSSQPSDAPPLERLPTAEATGVDGRPRLLAAVRGSADLALLTPDANNRTIDGSSSSSPRSRS